MKKLQNSKCRIPGYFHDFRIILNFPEGSLEGCVRCKKRVFFKNNVTNSHYLSYHIRSTLQRDNPRFNKEYAKRQL